jgi:NADH dehydrogenase/NADH oxidase (H2O2-forming)
MKKILAIGGGGAGMFSCVVPTQLKKGAYSAIVLSDEKDIYCRCTTPYIMTGNATLKDAIQPDSMVGDYGVDIVHEKAVRLDTRKQQVTTDKGNILDYDYLVISTGAAPIRPKIEGSDLPGVFTIRDSNDVKNLHAAIKKAKKAVVVGAGVIGIEMAGALRTKGLEVSLVEMASSISPNIADQEFAGKITDLLQAAGVGVKFETKVEAIRIMKGERKSVIAACQGKRIEFEADVIIFAIGVRPNLEILNNTGIKMVAQGIVVDDKMRTNIRNIYACGDCCVPKSAVTGEAKPSALASSAIQQSKIVGFQIAGYPIKYNGSTGAFAFETLGKQYAAVGLTEAAAKERFKLVVTGKAVTTDVYRDLKGNKELEVKLIFAGPKMRLVGYEAFGSGVIASAELASFAIGLRLSILKMLKFNYIAHPSMTPWPFMNPIIMATEDAMGAIMAGVKRFFRLG